MPGDPIDYTQHAFLYAHSIAKPLTGRIDAGPVAGADGFVSHGVLDSIAARHFDPPPARLLSLGAGLCFAEEYLVSRGHVGHVTAYEPSAAAVARARARLSTRPYAARIDVRQGDVLDDAWPDGHFDAVFVLAAIHHFERIDDMFALMHRLLTPGGLLWYDEYVGPDLHQYPPDAMALMDAINECLAPQYRRDHASGTVRDALPRPSRAWMLQHDASEGVHASRILPLTYQWFDVLDRRDYGGAILRPFFSGILPNFDWDDPKDRTVARLIILLEQMLTRHGVLPTYHTALVARRREAPRPPLTAKEAHRIAYAGWPARE